MSTSRGPGPLYDIRIIQMPWWWTIQQWVPAFEDSGWWTLRRCFRREKAERIAKQMAAEAGVRYIGEVQHHDRTEANRGEL